METIVRTKKQGTEVDLPQIIMRHSLMPYKAQLDFEEEAMQIKARFDKLRGRGVCIHWRGRRAGLPIKLGSVGPKYVPLSDLPRRYRLRVECDATTLGGDAPDLVEVVSFSGIAHDSEEVLGEEIFYPTIKKRPNRGKLEKIKRLKSQLLPIIFVDILYAPGIKVYNYVGKPL